VLLYRVRRILFFDRLADQRSDRGGRLSARPPWRVFVLALSSCVVALTPLAYASPGDPLWIAGIYDAADYDEVVTAAAALESLVEDTLLVVSPGSIVADSAAAGTMARPAGATLDIAQPRAPPKS
jgi:hypothetical protein